MEANDDRLGTRDWPWLMPDLHCCSILIPFRALCFFALAAGPRKYKAFIPVQCQLSCHLLSPSSVKLDSAHALHLLFSEVTLCCFLLVLVRRIGDILHSSISQGLSLLLTLEESLLVLDIFEN